MIERPKSITICLVGGDPSKTKTQKELLSDLKYEVLFWCRSDKFTGNYYSWSQILNEAISESPNEYIIFINPKVTPLISDIEYIIDNLINGYCLVASIALGLYGSTIQLFREIDLFDERYIGSEFEDDDFVLRLKMFGKAIIWNFDKNRYPLYERTETIFSLDESATTYSPLRGCAQSFFERKWEDISTQDEVRALLDMNLYKTQKKLASHIRNSHNKEISNSWMEYSKSIIDISQDVARRGVITKIYRDYRESISVRTKGVIKIESNDNSEVVCRFHSDEPTKVYILLVNAVDGKEQAISGIKGLFSGYYNIDYYVPVENFEIKIFHEGEKIYHDRFCQFPINKQIDIGLRTIKKVGDPPIIE